jgi:hypothetical protein
VDGLSGCLLLVSLVLFKLLGEMPVLVVDLILQVLELAERVLQAAVELLDPLILLRDLVLK